MMGGRAPLTRRNAAALLAAGVGLACGVRAMAQAPPSTSSVVPAAKDETDRMTVPVWLDGRGPYAFIVDTASDHTALSQDVVLALGLPSAGQVIVDSATGKGPADSVRIGRLKVGAREVTGLRTPVFRAEDIGGDGLLGIDALKDQNIVMDFRSGQMTIQPSLRRDEPGEVVVSAKSRYGQLVLVDASIDDEDLYVVIDTGGEVSIANSALRALVNRRRQAQNAAGEVIGVSGEGARAEFDTLPHVRVGGVALSNLLVAYADVHAFERFGLRDRPAMLLGMDLLRHFDRVSVDFKARRVRFLLPPARS
jgi:predicted aspartyl protease